ncbi:DUF4326 domain-containing protein [Haemophilus seminalis]|uniref:DUF4326 domain-containing protein n=1 Tax=Haemophilus seminalis TaxID=2582921 RepID=A0ABQ6SJG3_9PAST|nr:DUF4326 domain-containing protein [Haemophilus seminalis]KAA5522517.1 DUF4326 domain-containing protein [Haemophilus seminalis]
MIEKNILILYPIEFKSFSKFERKINHILSKIKNFKIFSINDYNGFITNYFGAYEKIDIREIASCNITHAIIFSDREIFLDEISWFKEKNIPLRVVHIDITRVINIDIEDPAIYGDKYVYIGRNPNRTPNTPNWSNPYSMYDFQIGEEPLSREDVIHQFAYGFERENLPTNLTKADALQLRGKVLGCHCKPLACHGDILADYLNSLDDGK